ncbi:hypothetical protein LINPERHAP1_LOCUS5913 [Linum perenne]
MQPKRLNPTTGLAKRGKRRRQRRTYGERTDGGSSKREDGSRMGDKSVTAKKPPARSRSPAATRSRVRQQKLPSWKGKI